jgi:hypothetical protein
MNYTTQITTRLKKFGLHEGQIATLIPFFEDFAKKNNCTPLKACKEFIRSMKEKEAITPTTEVPPQ